MYYYLTIRSNLPSLTSKIDSPNRETCATCPSCNQLSTRAYSLPPTFEIRVRSKRAGEIWFARGGGSVCLSQKAEWCPRSRAKPATLVYVVSRRCFLPLAALFAILDPTIRPRQLLVSSYSATLPTLSTSLLSINYWRYLRGFWKILFDERWRGRSIIFLLFFFPSSLDSCLTSWLLINLLRRTKSKCNTKSNKEHEIDHFENYFWFGRSKWKFGWKFNIRNRIV